MTHNNFDVLTSADVFAAIYRDVDLGGFSEALAGKTLAVRVNPAALADRFITRDGEAPTYDQLRAAVAVLYEITPESVAKMDDLLVAYLARAGMDAYTKYHEELKGFLAPHSNGSTPSLASPR